MPQQRLQWFIFLLSSAAVGCDINIGDGDDGDDGGGGTDDGADDGDGDGGDGAEEAGDGAGGTGDGSDGAGDGAGDGAVDETGDGGDGGGGDVCEAYGAWFGECAGYDAAAYTQMCHDMLAYYYEYFGSECAAAAEEAFACLSDLPCQDIDPNACDAEIGAAEELCGGPVDGDSA